jgi:2',3'-cyclic-nucleotide 2'-phosphodiesterase (5'-nucleotidase family)
MPTSRCWAGRFGFIILGQDDRQELVVGAIGQPWRLAGGHGIAVAGANDFVAFNQAGYANLATLRQLLGEPVLTQQRRSLRLHLRNQWGGGGVVGAARNQIGAEIRRRTMPTTTARRARLPLILGMVAVLAACTPSSPPSQPPPPNGAAAPTTATSPALAPQARAGRGEVVITLFHETHLHGALLGMDQQSTTGPVAADGRTFANYAGVLDQQRRRLAPGASLFVGNGDDLSDNLEVPAVFGGGTVHTGSRHVLEAFAAAGLDADTFGYDMDQYLPDRIGHLRELVARSRFAWVSANVREGSRPSEVLAAEQGARLWVLKQVAGVRVGITGVVSPDFVQGDGAHAARVAPTVTLLDPVQALREVVPRMRAAGAQVVVVLSHLFFEEMQQVARQVEGVDAILGSHQGPSTGFLAEPLVIGGTIISKPGHDLAALGQLDLVVRRSDGRVVRYGFQRHQLAPNGPSSPAVKAILDRYRAAR